MNSEVISQGIVLLGVLAGFAFVIAAEIVLRDPKPEKLERIASNFFMVGLVSLVTVEVGIVYLALAGQPEKQESPARIFVFGLAACGVIFVLALLSLFHARFSGGARRQMLFATGAVIVMAILTATFLR